ncbi:MULTISPECIES: alpha-1,2-fucosyltransferase [Arthrobacter]|uniref:Alpha-1,2-fucosyltransferase n=2 Tax=Arthrobacter TaxID=1663 RepID=A0ABU9KQB3_9MICC|nr:alpha-1,2-fucosyltransferase [Arthrobacter sp. YJM1]MDP5227698.1 alpha-1,2-fucosyltransferase [Arthrobacter sp. YJM1]
MFRSMRDLKSVTLEAIRRNGREIAWTAPWMNLGNYLMLGLWAHKSAGRKVLRHPGHDLLDLFPLFSERYLLAESRVRFMDQRVMPWSGGGSREIDWSQLSVFVREQLLPGSPLHDGGSGRQGQLVVNVRRGDYYSVEQNRQTFGINIPAYVSTAVATAMDDGWLPSSILVVSDDPGWCRENLHGILGATAPVSYRPPKDPIGDLQALIHAERLIIPNSTFSMWGGYIGDELHPGRQVYAPWIFARGINGGEGQEYKPEWTIIRDIPGGWGLISE